MGAATPVPLVGVSVSEPNPGLGTSVTREDQHLDKKKVSAVVPQWVLCLERLDRTVQQKRSGYAAVT